MSEDYYFMFMDILPSLSLLQFIGINTALGCSLFLFDGTLYRHLVLQNLDLSEESSGQIQSSILCPVLKCTVFSVIMTYLLSTCERQQSTTIAYIILGVSQATQTNNSQGKFLCLVVEDLLDGLWLLWGKFSAYCH